MIQVAALTNLIPITRCRLSGSTNLIPVADFGEHALSGVFPKPGDPPVMRGPLGLCWCPDSGLLQLDHVYPADVMYGANYGYRSGLNASMVRHLHAKARKLEQMAGLKAGDVVLDIGSNDGTLLGGYETRGLDLVGMDPTANKFVSLGLYPANAAVLPWFFDAETYLKYRPRAKLITSIACLYDLDDPLTFARHVADCLARDGQWHLEVAYMPAMLRSGAYDAVCQEHACYYSARTLRRLLHMAGFYVADVEFNDVNGGSMAITAKVLNHPLGRNEHVGFVVGEEDTIGLNSPAPYIDFANRAAVHRGELRKLLTDLHASGARILCYGASTKGNTLLQYCGIGPDLALAAAEVNPDKFGCLTATGIPIVSEDEARAMEPTHYLVLPHHFRAGILERERAFRERGGKFIFPFPIEVV